MTWYELKIPCPVTGCANQYVKPFNWVCVEDNEKMYVSDEGRLACSKGAHNDLIINWKFDCGDRSGVHKNCHFLSPDYAGLSHAIAMAVPLLPQAGLQWFTTLMTNIDRQYKQ